MTRNWPATLQNSLEATSSYQGDFENSPAKRRRLENEVHSKITIQTGTKTLYSWIPNDPPSQVRPRMTVVDHRNGQHNEPVQHTQSQHILTEAFSQQYPVFDTKLRKEYSNSDWQRTDARHNILYEPEIDSHQEVPIRNSVPCLSSTPLSNIMEADQVCYGMITELEADMNWTQHVYHDDHVSIVFSPPDELYVGENLVGNLEDRSAQILRVLSDDPLINVQVILPSQDPKLGRSNKVAVGQRPKWLHISVIIYGPESLANDVGQFCQACDAYLQDPVGCNQNLLYRNPHRFSSSEDATCFTFDIEELNIGTTVTQLNNCHFLDSLIVSRSLYELETPPNVGTQLLLHQRQALYFMTQRELGWNYDDTSQDIWTRSSSKGFTRYRNNITGSWQSQKPTQFKGGILADSMGLGKSCSMIALMASDWKDRLVQKSPVIGLQGSFHVPATLLIVPPSLLSTWEEQLQRHLIASQFPRIRRHHGSKRFLDVDHIRQYDLILTTYQTIESEWRISSHSKPLPIFAATWRRILLDEAHYVSNRLSSTFKAICNLQAYARWAVTGTPLQNKLGDLATICEFLRVYPYDNREAFEKDIVSLWKSGQNELAISRLKQLIHCVLLRRTQSVVHLPQRTDLKFTLRFNRKEREYYETVERNVASTIDAAIDKSSRASTSFASIIQQITKLRLICNLGTHRKPAKRVPASHINFWNSQTARRALVALASTGTIVCSVCSLDLYGGIMEQSLGPDLAFCSPRVQISSCLNIICESCTSHDIRARCGCTPPCPMIEILYTTENTLSGVSSPALNPLGDDEELLPTKITALITDLLNQAEGTKSIVFSFWTSTLDLVEKGLSQASISYARYDGNTSATNRSLALKMFREDRSLSVILMTISCSAVGLDITAASRAYIMEPQWNPTVEEQALARVHRMGQMKEVTTVRFVMEGTFEERVVETQDKKRELAELLLSTDQDTEKEYSIDKLKYFRSLLR
ncbi:SNF2 family N-terminal domain-containing protein [Pyrenochaeta sp. MPI-SDFR-AT-0127]|nr:SNF2 family N-terminal domain-containing protein [Pyrenochaeta sp. MPI-SDFR-AT-0127]